jgi:hypothetical protein
MELRLRSGPWTTVFHGTFLGHEMELLRNPEGVLLVAIFEKEAGITSGVLLQAFNVFNAIGEVQGFVENLSNEAIVLSRHDGKNSVHFLLAGSKPEYSRMQEEKLAATVDELMHQARQRSKMLSDISKAYELQLAPLQACDESIRQLFFSQPFIIPAFFKEEKKTAEERAASVPSGASMLVGITKEGKQIKEPLHFFKTTVVEGSTEKERMHFIHLLIESALIGNVTAIVFDRRYYFSGLQKPNRNSALLQRFKVDIEPIGFPVKNFKAAQDLKANLASIDMAALLQSFGCSAVTCQLVQNAASGKQIESQAQLIEAVNATSGEQTYLFEINRANRIIKLIDSIYPGLFNGSNDLQEIAKGWTHIGRASIVQTTELDKRAEAILVNGLLNELLAFFKQKGETKAMRCIVVLPEAEKIFPRNQSALSKNSLNALKQLPQFGVGFAVTAEKTLDLDNELLNLADAMVTIVKENDAAIQLKGQKGYRATLRPGLSECSETE